MDSKADLLHGSLADKILYFVLPLAITGILQQLFNAADVVVVGRFAGKEAMAAVGSNSPVIGLLINLFVGISIGVNVVIANAVGRKDFDDVKNAVHTSILTGLIVGIIVGFWGFAVANSALSLLDVPQDVFPKALSYFRIYMLGLPFVLLYNFEAAIFRSVGDSRTPLIWLTIAGILNVILNVFFVVFWGLDASGVALATVLSNMVGSAAMFVILLRTNSIIHVEIKSLKLHVPSLLAMLKIGLPAGIQSTLFSISNVIIQSAINILGASVMAASAAAFNVEIFCYFVVNAFGQACTTFVGQNYGAKNFARCRKITRIALLMDMVCTIAMSAMLVFFSENILGLFSDDSDIIELAKLRIVYITAFQFVNVFLEIISGTLRGYGNSLMPAVISFVGICGVRIAWVFTAFKLSQTFENLLTCYPLSWATTAIILIAYYFWYKQSIVYSVRKKTFD